MNGPGRPRVDGRHAHSDPNLAEQARDRQWAAQTPVMTPDERTPPCATLPAVPPRYDSKAALVVVDMQNDFADPQGSLFVKGAASILPLVNSEARLAREAGALVVYTQDWHPESTHHFAKDGGIWPVHCVGGTWGADFHPALDVDGPTDPQGHERRGRLLRLLDEGPGDRRDVADRARGAAPRARHRAGRRRGPGDGLLRQRDGDRRGAARLREPRSSRTPSPRSTSRPTTARGRST